MRSDPNAALNLPAASWRRPCAVVAGPRRLDAVGRTDSQLHVGRHAAWRSTWPAGGPKKLWTRALGEGHSAILAEGGRLYTMYRPLGAVGGRSGAARKKSSPRSTRRPARRSGSTNIPRRPTGLDFSQGAGPHATPLIAGNRLFADRHAQGALRARQGDRQAALVARSDQGVRCAVAGPRLRVQPARSTTAPSSSRSADRPGIAAFNEQTGALVWKAGDFEPSPASPIVIDVDGQQQLLVFAGDRVAGMNPANGADAVDPSAQDRLGTEHQHAGLVAVRSPAVRLVGVQHRQPRASSCIRRAARPRSPRSGSPTGCACTSAR